MTRDEAMQAVERRSLVEAISGTGQVVDHGRVIAYSIVPTLTIERADGSRFSWRHDMVAVDVIDQIIDERAEESAKIEGVCTCDGPERDFLVALSCGLPEHREEAYTLSQEFEAWRKAKYDRRDT